MCLEMKTQYTPLHGTPPPRDWVLLMTWILTGSVSQLGNVVLKHLIDTAVDPLVCGLVPLKSIHC